MRTSDAAIGPYQWKRKDQKKQNLIHLFQKESQRKERGNLNAVQKQPVNSQCVLVQGL